VLAAGTTLDGELVVLGTDGRVDFEGMRRRGFGQAAGGRLVFVAFDVLASAGEDVMAQRWEKRRRILDDLGLDGAAWCTTPSCPGEGRTLFEATRAEGLEGVVAKRLDAPYRSGVRTAAWVKTKHFDRGWFDVLGVAPTPEERYALVLGFRDAGGVRYAGRVEWGFTRAHFEELAARARPTEGNPFGDWAPRGSMFFEPGVVAEVRYLAGSCATPRHAAVAGVRSVGRGAGALSLVGVAAGPTEHPPLELLEGGEDHHGVVPAEPRQLAGGEHGHGPAVISGPRP
jgi:bifunctional non-homologous end joining protein LigD